MTAIMVFSCVVGLSMQFSDFNVTLVTFITSEQKHPTLQPQLLNNRSANFLATFHS
jgi:hypothetical protein